MRKALTIAGSDSCGGAGIQADLKTFSALGVYGMSVITAVTAQNTVGVRAVQDITPAVIQEQIAAIFEDISVDAVKIGMVSRTETIEVIAKALVKYQARNVVVDPVMISKRGHYLLEPEARQALVETLLPLANVVSPNIPEAEVMTGRPIKTVQDMEQAALSIAAHGPKHVLVKGGHLQADAVDVLYDVESASFRHFSSPRINTPHTHGTGCTLSAAIAANLAMGVPTEESILRAKQYVTMAIEYSFSIGKGVGPTNHFYDLYRKAGISIVE